MIRILLLFLSFFLANISHSKIVYIDVEKIMNDSKPGIFINEELNKISKKNNSEILKLENKIKTEEKKLLDQKNILDENEFNKQFNKLKLDVQKFQKTKINKNNELNQKNIYYKKKLMNLLEPILRDFVKKEKISLLLQKKYIVVGNKEIDITDKIIKDINSKIKIDSLK